MIDIYNISHKEYLEDLFANEKITNHPSGNPTSYLTSHIDLTSPEVKDDIFDPEGDIIENLLNLDKTKDLPPYHDIILVCSTTSSSLSLPISETSDYFLEEFANELAHFAFPPGIDYLPFDIKIDLREIEYLLNHDTIKEMDSILEDSVDKNSLDDNLVDTIFEMFTNEYALDYSSPPLWDDYDDQLFDLETVNDDTYDDHFDSREEKIKDAKLLIDELDSPESSDFLPFLNVTWFSMRISLRKRISMKRMENEAKNDKTEHGMEEHEKDKVKIKVKVQKVKVKVNPDEVKGQRRSRKRRNVKWAHPYPSNGPGQPI
ncbi:hypothetical protein Tco_0015441 [Tanacetum coccineum]